LGASATTMAQAFTVLSKSTTVSRYQEAVTSTRLSQALAEFNSDYSALGNKLSSF
jgi:hypothetical protein